jgi:hypothetical protein
LNSRPQAIRTRVDRVLVDSKMKSSIAAKIIRNGLSRLLQRSSTCRGEDLDSATISLVAG